MCISLKIIQSKLFANMDIEENDNFLTNFINILDKIIQVLKALRELIGSVKQIQK